MLSIRTFQARVQKSAKLLDSERINWHQQINLNNLYMGSSSDCIVGQLGMSIILDDMDNKRAFYISYDNRPKEFENLAVDCMDFLTRLWKYQIKKRLRCDERKKIDAMYRC